MKSHRMPAYRTSLVLLILVLFAITGLPGGAAQAALQYTFDCESCHHMPPLDTADGKRDPESGGMKGNHSTHSGTTASSCTVCHGPGVLTTAHLDKTIQINGHADKTVLNGVINNSPAAGAVYTRSAGAFINQTSLPALGSCNNVNCHFEKTSPIWGTIFKTPQEDPGTCGACHGNASNAAPADGNHPGSSQQGLKHAAYYGTGNDSCAKCHPNHLLDGAPFAHASSASPGGRDLIVSFNASPNAGGSYSKSANLAYPNYLPSRNPLRDGTCSGLYCHSDGAGNTTTATWGGALTCGGCHGFSAIATNRHAEHLNPAKVGRTLGCQDCHSATTADGSSIVVANHVDKNINVKFDNALNRDGDLPYYNGQPASGAAGSVKAPQSPVGSCANVYCHSVGNVDAAGNLVPVAGQSYRSIGWSDAVIGCSSCHGDGLGKSHPVYQSGAPGSSTANNHVKHVEDKSYGCDLCHFSTTHDTAVPPTSVLSNGQHLNRLENVQFNSYGGQTGSYDSNKTCSATYCHSSGEATFAAPLITPQWGGAKLDCRGCHGGDADHANPIVTGRHGAHIAANRPGAATKLVCAECHASTINTYDNNTTLTGQLKHVNTYREYSGARAGQMASFYTQQTCGNLYCHSSGEANPVFRNMTGEKRWGGSAAIGCNGCHGYLDGEFAPVAGEPNYKNEAGRKNSHKKHTVDDGMTDSTGCALCHRTTVDQSVKNKLKSYSSVHLNGVRDVTFAPLGNMTGHYVAATQECSNTYCHGNAGTIAWGSSTPLLCDACHKANSLLSGSHASHVSSTLATSYAAAPANLTGTATSYNFECSSCHRGAHAKGPSTRGNAAEVFFGYTALSRSGRYDYGFTTDMDGGLQWSNGTCTTTYCHSQGDAALSEGKATGSITWASAAKSLRCDGCHGGDASKPASMITTGMHRNHIDPSLSGSPLGQGNGLKCADCHAKTVAFASNTTVTDRRNHVNKFRDYSGVMAGDSASYSQSNKTCTSYCHSNGKGSVPVVGQYPSAGRWDSGSALNCNGCHGNAQAGAVDPSFGSNPQLGTPNYQNQGTGPGSNSHKLHVQKMGIATANACYVCHAKTVQRDSAQGKFRPYSTAHLKATSADVTFGKMSTATFKLMSSVGKASWDKMNRTCSTVTCHSNGRGAYQSARWGETSNCAYCHPMNKLSRGHIFHVYTSAVPTFYDNYTANRSDSVRYNFGCANCHPVNNPNHMKGPVVVDVSQGAIGTVGRLRSLNGSDAAVTRNGSQVFCSNIYCHSNGYQANLVYASIPEWNAGSFSGDRCAACHGNWPNDTDNGNPVGSASHFNKNWLASGTSGGHYIGIHARTITNKMDAAAPETFIGLLSPSATEPSSHGYPGSSTTISCNICHWDTVKTASNYGSNLCGSCHTQPAGRGLATIADKSKHVTGQPLVSFQPSVIRSKAQIRDVSFSDISGAGPWRRSGVYKSPTGFDYSKQPLSPAAGWSGGNCSSVVCHFGNSVQWNIPSGGMTCESCHTSM